MLRSSIVKGVYRNLLSICEPTKLLNFELINISRVESRLLSTAAAAISIKQQPFGYHGLLVIKPTLSQEQPSRSYAARKGTRARKAAKKVKKEETKKVFVFKQLRKLQALPYQKQRPIDDSNFPEPIDDAHSSQSKARKAFPFDEAVQNFREHLHPTTRNCPTAPLYLRVNMDLKYPNRVTKCMDGWRSVVEMKQPFLLDGMVQPGVLAFCPEDILFIDEVKAGGADLAGGKELIKAIQAGEINTEEFEYVVAHPSVVPELTVIRGLMKKKFPTVRNRTVSPDLVPEIRRLKSGIKIHVVKNDREPDFGYIETPIGTIDMDGLIENFKSVLRDTVPRRVANKSPEDFILSCVLKTPVDGVEEFKVDIKSILDELRNEKTTKAEH